MFSWNGNILERVEICLDVSDNFLEQNSDKNPKL